MITSASRFFSAAATATTRNPRAIMLQEITDRLNEYVALPSEQKTTREALNILSSVVTTAEGKEAIARCNAKIAEVDGFWEAFGRMQATEPDWTFWENELKYPAVVNSHRAYFQKVTGNKPISSPSSAAKEYKKAFEEFQNAHRKENNLFSGNYKENASKLYADVTSKYPLFTKKGKYLPPGFDGEKAKEARSKLLEKAISLAERTEKISKKIESEFSAQIKDIERKDKELLAKVEKNQTIKTSDWIKENPALAKMVWEEIDNGDYDETITEEKRQKYKDILARSN